MQNFRRSNNTFVLIGDYDIDISKQNIDNKIQNHANKLYLSECFSLINKSTRITSTSATSLDHICSNSLKKFSVSGILVSDVLHHLPTFCITKSNIHRNFTPGIMIRNMKKFNAEAFSEDVSNKLEYLSCSLNDDPNTEIHCILSAMTEATNLHVP